jgi:hypothetical protein
VIQFCIMFAGLAGTITAGAACRADGARSRGARHVGTPESTRRAATSIPRRARQWLAVLVTVVGLFVSTMVGRMECTRPIK